MALRDIVPRRQPRGYIKWGYSQVLYLTYTTGIFLENNTPDPQIQWKEAVNLVLSYPHLNITVITLILK